MNIYYPIKTYKIKWRSDSLAFDMINRIKYKKISPFIKNGELYNNLITPRFDWVDSLFPITRDMDDNWYKGFPYKLLACNDGGGWYCLSQYQYHAKYCVHRLPKLSVYDGVWLKQSVHQL